MLKLISALLGLLATQSRQAAFEVPGKDSTNTAIYTDSCYTADCSNCQYKSWVLSSGNYALSKVDIWISGSSFQGIQLSYKDASNNVLVGNLIGESSGITATSYTITKQVVGVTMKQLGPHTRNTKQPQSGFILHYADATTQSIGAVVATDTAFYSPLTVGLLGLRCNFHESPHGSNFFDKSYGCIPYDNVCTDYSLDNRTISNMAILVSQSTTQDISFSLCVYQACGTRVYTITPTLSFLTLSGTTLTLSTNNPADAGAYSLNLTVQLQSYPTVATVTKNFQVTVTCTVLSLLFTTTTPVSQTVRIGVDAQPFSIPSAYTKTPLCSQTPLLTLTPNNLAFLTVNSSGNGGSLMINGATVTHKGTYSISLVASVDSLTASVSITLTISDLCETSTLVTSPVALSPMTINMPSASSQTQAIAITTDVHMAYPTVVCNLATLLTPIAAYISLAADLKTIIVDTSKINLPSDIGVHPFSLAIKSFDYPGTVTPITLNFDVNIVCTVQGFQVTSRPVDANYILNKGPVFTQPFNSIQYAACKFPQSYTQTYLKNGVAIPQPTWISFDSVDKTLKMDVTNVADVGVYSITNTVSIPQLDPLTGQNRILGESFILNVISDCAISALNDRALRDMSTVISGQPDQQSVAFTDTIGTFHNDQTYCETRSYQLMPSLPFLSISNSILTAASTNVADQGSYEVQLVVSLSAYPQVSPLTSNKFKVLVVCEILSIQQTVKLPTQLTQRILVDPIISQPYEFVSYPACNMEIALITLQTYTLQADLASQTVNGLTTQKIEIFASKPEQRGIFNFVLSAKPRFPNIGVNSSQQLKVVLIDLCEQAKFFDQKLQGINMTKQNPAYLVTQLLSLKPFDYSPLTDYRVNCGQIQTKLLILPTKKDPPSWIKMGSNSIQVNFFMVEKAIALQLELAVSLVDYPQIEMRQSFNVTLSDSELSCLPNPSETYILGDSPLQFAFAFLNKTQENVKLTPIREPVFMDKQGSPITKPSFLTYFPSSGTFTVESKSAESMGIYQIGLTLGYAEFPAAQVTCLKKLQVTYSPEFTPLREEVKDQTLVVFASWSYLLPVYNDFFGDKASIALDLGSAIDFLKYDALTGSLELQVAPSELRNYVGSYDLTVTLTDKMVGKKTLTFTIKVLDLTGAAQEEKVPVKLPPPKPYFEKVTQFGLVRIAFTRPIVLPTFDRYPEFSIDQNLNRNCTNGGICQPKRRLEILSQEEEKKEAIEIANRGLVWVNNTAHPLMKLFMLPGEDSDQSKLNFTWNCTEFENDYMDLEVNYQFKEQVSSHDDLDRIRVEFLGRQYFSADDGQFFLPEEAKIQRFVPSQMNPAQGKKLSLIAGMVGQSSKWLVVANFVKNALIGGSLSEMFGATNKLQLMVHLLITNVKIPANAQIYFSQLLQLVTFSLIDLEPLIRRWLHLQDQMDFNKNFFALGYHSVFFIVNLNNMLLAIIYHIIALCVILLTTPIANQRIQGWRSKLKAKICWNSILSFLNESLIIIALSCFMQFKFLTFKSKGETFSSVAALIFGLIVVEQPFLNLWLMIKNKNKLQYEEFKRSFETVYENLNYKRSPSLGVLIEPFLCQIRVLLMAFYLIYFEHYPYFQIFFTNLLVTFMVIHIEWFEVYRAKSYRRQQVFNEVFMCLINYHLICFADFIRDQPTITLVGWSAIVTITLNLGVNFSIVIYDSVKDAYKKLRIWYYRRKWTYLKHLLTKRRAKQQKQSQTVSNSGQIVEIENQQERKLPENEGQNRHDDLSNSSLFVSSHNVYIMPPELQGSSIENYVSAKFQRSKTALTEVDRKPHTTIGRNPHGIEEDDFVQVKNKPIMTRDRPTGRLILVSPDLSNPSKLTTARQSRLVSEDSSSRRSILDDVKLLRLADIHPQPNRQGKTLEISSLCEDSQDNQLASPDRHMQEEREDSLEQWARVQKRARLATQAFPDVRTIELMFKKLWEPDE